VPATVSRPSTPLRFAAAVVGGFAVWTSFPPLNWWPAAPIGLAALVLLVRGVRRRVAVIAGWLFGLGFCVPLLSFLRGIGVDAWLVLALIESLWFALLALAFRMVAPRRWWPLAVPVLVVAQEWVRDRWPFGGLPWGRLAFGQANGPLLPAAALGGAVLLTFLTALLAAAVAVLSLAGRDRWAGSRAGGVGRPAAAVAVVLGVVLLPAAVPTPTSGSRAHGPASAVVAAVQGNVPRLGLEEFAQARAVTRDHAAQTAELAADIAAGRVPHPDIVVWPENASDMDPYRDAQAHQLIDGAVRAVGVPVLVGAVLDGPGDRVRNAAIVWSPTTGPGAIYVKRHLVPFGEYLPLRSVLTRLVGRFSMIGHDFAPGHTPGVLDVGPVRLADVICFEVADDGVVRDAVDGGGRLLVVQTNNATYERVGDDGYGGETAQQLAMSRLRAVEHGRAVVVAATSGVSALIAPDGRILQRSGVFRPARLVASLPLRDARTVADRLGAWPERILALLGALALVAAMPRRRPRPAPAPVTRDDPTPLTAGR
jgi:apolipoprotein N-acyltransferase